MFYNSAEVDEDLRCSFCKQRFTDVIKLVPDCGESICGECHDELQSNLDATREFTCKTCQDRHVMPPKGLPDNRGLCRMLKRRKIEKPISEQARKLKEELAVLKENLATLKQFDPREHIGIHCDSLECQVVETFNSAIIQLQKLEQESLKQIQDYRRECFESWQTKNAKDPQTTEEDSKPVENRDKLQDLNQKITELTNKWDEFFSLPDTSANDGDIYLAQEEANKLDNLLVSLKSSMISQIFGGKVLTFKPVTTFFEDENHLKEVYKFKLDFEPAKVCQIQTTPSHDLKKHTDSVNCVVHVPGGRFASCSTDKKIKVWNAQDGAEAFELQGHEKGVLCLAVLPSGWLASGSSDKTIRIWELNQKREIKALRGHTHDIYSLAVLKNGNLASYSTDDTIRVWNPYRTADNLLLTIPGHGNLYYNWPLTVLSNGHFATYSNESDCELKVWDSTDGKLVKAVSIGYMDILTLFATANDQVAVGFTNGTIKLIDWIDAARSRSKEKAHTSSVSAFAQLSNGCLLSAGFDASPKGNSIKMWDLDTFSLLQTLTTGHSSSIQSLSLLPDETVLATASRDSTIKLWPIISTTF